MSKPRKLLAYAVQETCEGTGGIVFAYTNAQARREGSQEFSDGDFDSVECHRAQWADQYAPGPVPVLALLDHGWWQECHKCYRQCSAEEDYEGHPIAPVEENGRLFCSAECQTAFHRDNEEIAALTELAVAHEISRLLKAHPGVTILPDRHVYTTVHDGVRHVGQIRLKFTFPGCKIGPASWGFYNVGEQPQAMVCYGDMDAWKAWRKIRQ